MTLKNLMNTAIIAMAIPVITAAVFMPVISKFFYASANVETIGSAQIVSGAVTMFVSAVGCWSNGLKIFNKLYYPMFIADIAMAIIIAVLGVEHVEMRFYLNALQSALCGAVVDQSLNYYIMLVIPREEIQLFSNRIKTMFGGAGLVGSFLAVMLGDININIALWVIVALTIFDFILSSFLRNEFKKLSEEKAQD